MVKLANVISRIHSAKILVVGDMLLDTYTLGKARRISPEAPVPIVNIYKEEHRPGGAGNVILNLLSLGAEVVAVGRVGSDWAGQTFLNALKEENVDARMIVNQEGYNTPVKNRIIADNQQIVRLDYEEIVPLNEPLEQYIIENFCLLLQDVKVVTISDYGKGFLTPTLLAEIFYQSKKKGVPVITDPKGHDFYKYKGTTIIKPNLSEAFAAANLPSNSPLEQVASIVLNQTQANQLMITRSEAGISLFDQNGKRKDFPVKVKEVKDVTGAGDTVLAMLAYALANDLTMDESAQLCNIAAGIAIEHIGCVRVALSDLALRLFEHSINHKVFDLDHIFILQDILKRKPFSIIVLSQVNELTQSIFQVIKEVGRGKEEALMIYVDHIQPSETFIEMLASLREIDYIIYQPESFKSLYRNVVPKEAYIFDGTESRIMKIDWTSNLNQHFALDEVIS